MQAEIGIIGGSGLYDMPELADRETVRLSTPFGDPSGPYLVATLPADGRYTVRVRRWMPVAPLGRLGFDSAICGVPSPSTQRTAKLCRPASNGQS